MRPETFSEFHIPSFADFYEPLTDSFIDIERVAESLKKHIRKSEVLFEIGLGTGYFASKLTRDGYVVKGIQPKDEMLTVLKRNHADIEVLGECLLQDYVFREQYAAIVSHSSVFLFTRHQSKFGAHGEVLTSFIFQSFIKCRDEMVRSLHKTLRALTNNGQLFINIQTNPLPLVTVRNGDDELTFEMTRCEYFLDLGLVEKTFHLTHKGESHHVNDTRYCETYAEFQAQVSRLGFRASVSDDRCWVIVSPL